ncbi:porin family protein [uncultured Bacteroides sp.]|uniref:porin family protein n=1 Tax=uncultured Bacteroides sp. TaxID=162156 RepID=UPI00280AFC56|nr:porin family protein [uncultured Bacteroides sp.]
MIKIKPFLIATLLLTGFTLPAIAQIGEARNNLSVGINGGINLNSTSFTPTVKQNSLMGITGGLTARYISEKYFAMICGAQVELNISQRGWDQLFETVSLDANGYEVTSKDPTKTYTRKMTYIDIPFLAHLAFGRDRGLQFFVHAGPQIGFLISESETIEGIDMNSLLDTQKALYGVKIQNKFDYGIAGGGGVELRTKKAGSFIVEGRYYFALSDFYSTTKKDYFARAAHGTITIKLTYLFDLKK